MGFFDFFRKEDDEVVDLSGQLPNDKSEKDLTSESNEKPKENLSPEEKKKRFVRRISEMIEKVENMSVKLYHIEQRLEVLERKLRVNNFKSE